VKRSKSQSENKKRIKETSGSRRKVS